MPVSSIRPVIWTLAVAGLVAAVEPAFAQGRLDARYAVTLSGLPIGKGAWVIDIADDQYTAAASGATAGLLRVFASGHGSGASRGFIVSGVPVPATFAASVTSDKKTDEIRMALSGGIVKDAVSTPPVPPNAERVPVAEAHRKGVTDPMTAALYRVPGNADLFGPEACPRTVPVFDGRMRYDLQFAYKRTERVQAEKGYDGPAAVCAVYFSPISGFIPSRAAIKYLIEQRGMEVSFAPVASTRVVVPFRVAIPTPIGLGVMQATQFVTSQPRAAAGPKTQ